MRKERNGCGVLCPEDGQERLSKRSLVLVECVVS
jgi:hypothetical protein